LMWSLNSPRERRTSGPENFQSSAKKDFFNTIRQKLPSAGSKSNFRLIPETGLNSAIAAFPK